MSTKYKILGRAPLPSFVLLVCFAAVLVPQGGRAQGLMLANPHWNITLTDFGYSDFLLDNTPGFEGREYLSGEWGAAIAYQPAGGIMLAPRFLDPMFLFPDWATLSTFGVKTPLIQTALNADNLPIAQAVLTNSHLEITLRFEMLDTVVGTPMGLKPAAEGGSSTPINSSRYVLKQTATMRNVSGEGITNLQFFQFLHGLQSQRGIYDNRFYPGPLDIFQYDMTQAGVDATAVGAGSSSAGLEDFIAFHASVAPSAFEIGHYGIEGNGVDDHSSGKPLDGVHLSIENNWLIPPYAARQGTDNFAPNNRWIGAAQRWSLGDLAVNQSVSLDVLLSLRTGTRVTTGTTVTGGCNGGSSVPGGLEYEFEDVSSDGACFGEYSKAEASEIEIRVARGEFTPFTFFTPGEPAQVWKVEFSGTFTGDVNLRFGYDPTVLPPSFDQSTLVLYQFTDGAWRSLESTVDTGLHTISVTTANFGMFALGVVPLVSHTVNATVSPANSGVISGSGTYPGFAQVTLVATPAVDYVFANWTEDAAVVSTSPGYTFSVQGDRTLVAHFVPIGSAKSISTISSPASGGTTSGDGAYAVGSSATVSATANVGYKFSKWQVNGLTVSSARVYTFSVSTNRVLVAKFKPVYYVDVSAAPEEGGEVDADPAYELGELAKLRARPNKDWCFLNWTQNGVPVSTDADFQFTVTGNRTLVGNFAFGNLIEVIALPANAGSVAGGGVYPFGEIVTVEGIPNPGYAFLYWTEDGIAISTEATFTFTSDLSRSLVANFVAQPSLASVLEPGGIVTLSWPAGATDWVLQESPDLSAHHWVNSTRTVTITGNRRQVQMAMPAGTAFFRLVRP